MRTSALLVLCLAGPACGRDAKTEPPKTSVVAPTADEPRIPPKPPERNNPSPEALARKARSEARLKKEGVKVASTLPVIETEAEAKSRARDAVVDRAVALTIVAIKGEGAQKPVVVSAAERFRATGFFSPEEKAFFLNDNPDKTTRVQFAWRYECLGVMLWALGFTPELGSPGKIVDAGRIVSLVMKDKGPNKLREEARLRSTKELLDEADLIYRYDWACVDARVNGAPAPPGVDCEIVVERHHALNWLIGYQGQEWDDVSTDT